MMIAKLKNHRLPELFAAVTAILCALKFGEECGRGVLEGIFFCVEELVPSLFPFMVVSVFIVKSGISGMLGKYLGKFSKPVFGISGGMFCALIMAIIGGYPVGARGIRTLTEHRETTKAQARSTAYAAVAAGPGFLINFVGFSLLSSREAGLCIFAAQAVSVFLLAFANRFIFLRKNYDDETSVPSTSLSASDALVESVMSAARGMLEMCAMVIAFSAVISVASAFAPSFRTYFSVLMEVSSACSLIGADVLLLAFAVGFGGMSVHFQIFTALRGLGINKAVFFLYRIIQGIMTSALTYIFIRAFRISMPVFSSISYSPELTLSSGVAGSALLILCGAVFVNRLRGNS